MQLGAGKSARGELRCNGVWLFNSVHELLESRAVDNCMLLVHFMLWTLPRWALPRRQLQGMMVASWLACIFDLMGDGKPRLLSVSFLIETLCLEDMYGRGEQGNHYKT